MHDTRLLSVATSSSVVVPVVLHSYPLCQQPVCVCVCVWGGGMKDAMVNRCRRAILMTHLPVCSGEVNGTIASSTHSLLCSYYMCIHTPYSLQYMYTPKYISHKLTHMHVYEHTPVLYHLDYPPGWTAGVVVCTQT